ncbi:hypothetical protein AYI68_g5659 [Smittium mucronatum]|uniref:Centrosomin N-terminal motif 1 domain-containing protein n=1 Tax=Smittium mucronatum TaxID=133383 RepID=A0A1R0GTS5_9FUNG|nr:hypothetical protein AYI68_g5659 [Smittium mucronatum]
MLGSANHNNQYSWNGRPGAKSPDILHSSNSSIDSNDSFVLKKSSARGINLNHNRSNRLNSPLEQFPSNLYSEKHTALHKQPGPKSSCSSIHVSNSEPDISEIQNPIPEFSNLSLKNQENPPNFNPSRNISGNYSKVLPINRFSRSNVNSYDHTDKVFKRRDSGASSGPIDRQYPLKNSISSIPTPLRNNHSHSHFQSSNNPSFNSLNSSQLDKNSTFSYPLKGNRASVNSFSQKSSHTSHFRNSTTAIPLNLTTPKNHDSNNPILSSRNRISSNIKNDFNPIPNSNLLKSLDNSYTKRMSLANSKPQYSPTLDRFSSYQRRKNSLETLPNPKPSTAKSVARSSVADSTSRLNRPRQSIRSSTNPSIDPIPSRNIYRNSKGLNLSNSINHNNNNSSVKEFKTPLQKDSVRVARSLIDTTKKELVSNPDSSSDNSLEAPKLQSVKSENSKIQQLLKENFDLKIRNQTLMDSLNQLSDEGLEAIINDFTRARASNVRANNEIIRLKDKISSLKKTIKLLEKDINDPYKCQAQHGMSQEELDHLNSLKSQVADLENQLSLSVDENRINLENISDLKCELERQIKINDQLRSDSLHERAKTELWQNLAQSPQSKSSNNPTSKKTHNLSLYGPQNQNRLRTGTSTTTATSETLFNNYDINSDLEITDPYFGYESSDVRGGPIVGEFSGKKIMKNRMDSSDDLENTRHQGSESRFLGYIENPNEIYKEFEKLSAQKTDIEQKLLYQQQEHQKLMSIINGSAFNDLSASRDNFHDAEIIFLKSKISNLESENNEKTQTISKLTEFIKEFQNMVEKSSKSYLNTLHEVTVNPLLEHKVKSLLETLKRG